MNISFVPLSLQVASLDPFVVKAVFSKPGVRNGNLLPYDELAAHVDAWNDTRVVVGHPQREGVFVSAKTPDIPYVGRLYDAAYADGLTGNMQLETDALKEAGIYDRLASGEVMEVSAAFWADVEPALGIHKGVPYTGISRNLVPDHIALLPNEVGACSCKDGCGVFATHASAESAPLSRISWLVQDALWASSELYPISVFMNYAIAANGNGRLFRVPYTLDDSLAVTLGEPVPILLSIIEETDMPTEQTTDVIMALVAELGGEEALRQIAADRARQREDALSTLSVQVPGVNFTALPTDQLVVLVTRTAPAARAPEPTGFGPMPAPEPVQLLTLEEIK